MAASSVQLATQLWLIVTTEPQSFVPGYLLITYLYSVRNFHTRFLDVHERQLCIGACWQRFQERPINNNIVCSFFIPAIVKSYEIIPNHAKPYHNTLGLIKHYITSNLRFLLVFTLSLKPRLFHNVQMKTTFSLVSHPIYLKTVLE